MFAIFKASKELIYKYNNPNYRPTPEYEEKHYPEMSRYVIRATFDGKDNQAVLQCKLFDKDKRIFIDDLHIGKENELWFYTQKGYYSEIMNMLIDFATKNQYKIIQGKLKAFDLCRRERQIKFYEKFGFVIHEPDEKKDCLIELHISNNT